MGSNKPHTLFNSFNNLAIGYSRYANNWVKDKKVKRNKRVQSELYVGQA